MEVEKNHIFNKTQRPIDYNLTTNGIDFIKKLKFFIYVCLISSLNWVVNSRKEIILKEIEAKSRENEENCLVNKLFNYLLSI